MAELGLIADGSLLIDGQRIDEVGSTRRIENLSKARHARLLDVSGKVVAPGFVDSHTRLMSLPHSREIARSLDPLNPIHLPPRPVEGANGASLRIRRLRARAWTYRLAAGGTTTIEIRLGLEGRASDPARGLRAILAVDHDPIRVASVISLRGESLEPDPVQRIEEIIRSVTRAGRKRLADAFELEGPSSSWGPGVCEAIRERCAAAGFGIKIVDRAGVGIESPGAPPVWARAA